MEWSPSWTQQSIPPMDAVVSDTRSHPGETTHYEFVFEVPANKALQTDIVM